MVLFGEAKMHCSMRRVLLCIFYILFQLIQQTTSFWGVSHMLVAQVAKNTLSQATLNCAVQTLQTDYYPNYSEFITAALWSDHIKASKPPFGLGFNGGTRAYDEWHFIDFPLSTSEAYSCETVKEENIVWALKRLITDAGRKELTSKGPVVISYGVALRMAIHYLGDIHQPLHCISHCDSYSKKGDYGGNKFYVDNGNYSSNVHNLHAFWDSGAGQFDNVEDGLTEEEQVLKVPPIARRIMEEFPKEQLKVDFKIDSNIGDSDTFNQWAKESFNIAKNVAYDPTLKRTGKCGKHSTCATIPDSYRENAQNIIRKRIALGGYRLAAYIEHYFPPSTLNCGSDRHGGISIGIFILMLIITFLVGSVFGFFVLNKLCPGKGNAAGIFSYQSQVDNNEFEFTQMGGNNGNV
jgi:hypothetical protein